MRFADSDTLRTAEGTAGPKPALRKTPTLEKVTHERVNYTCPICGSTFADWPSQNRKYCSRKCADEGFKGRISWWINKGLENPSMSQKNRDKLRQRNLNNPIRYWLGKKRSDMVGNDFRKGLRPINYAKIGVTCACCGKVLLRQPARVTRNKKHFCDRKCKAKWQSKNLRGENSPSWLGGYISEKEKYFRLTTSPWFRLRQEILKRDNYICQKCGTHENLCVHHIVPYRLSRSHSKENLIIYCKNCHSKEEWKCRRILYVVS
jgi:5-methylcytosine-specific restriction endonuclease McrA